MEARWSDTVEDYYPIHPHPRWGYDNPPNTAIQRALDRERASYDATITDIHRHRLALYDIALTGDPATGHPFWNNIWFSCLDAAALVSLLLARRPKRFVEIGSGFSTLFARHAVRWGKLDTTITSIDPQPRVMVDAICDSVVRSPLEECAPEMFDVLNPGDILFFDGSHRIFTNSDTTVLFFEILPRLRPGILVHLHDIFLPCDYPAAWNGRLYSEQYLLGAMLLCGSPPFRPILPSFYVCNDEPFAARIKNIFDGRPDAPIPFTYNNDAQIPGVSFWFETV